MVFDVPIRVVFCCLLPPKSSTFWVLSAVIPPQPFLEMLKTQALSLAWSWNLKKEDVDVGQEIQLEAELRWFKISKDLKKSWALLYKRLTSSVFFTSTHPIQAASQESKWHSKQPPGRRSRHRPNPSWTNPPWSLAKGFMGGSGGRWQR